jgi:hypothetical protein
MRSRSEIWDAVSQDLGAASSVSTQRDYVTVCKRAAAEGDPFFTVTLPSFGKEFERTLRDGVIHPGSFPGWKRRDLKITLLRRGSDTVLKAAKVPVGPPIFLGGFFDLLFHFAGDISTTDEGVFEYLQKFDINSPHPYEPILHVHESAQKAFESPGFGRMADAVAAIRQLTLLFGKEKVQAPPSKVAEAIRAYEMTDKELDFPL